MTMRLPLAHASVTTTPMLLPGKQAIDVIHRRMPGRIQDFIRASVSVVTASAAGYGPTWLGSFAKYNHDSSLWRTEPRVAVRSSRRVRRPLTQDVLRRFEEPGLDPANPLIAMWASAPVGRSLS